MYSNYIFDLYGTLVDINTDEENPNLWEKLSLFYSFNGGIYTASELKSQYITLVEKELSFLTNTKYPDFPLENVFKKLYIQKNVNPSNELVEHTAQLFRALSITYIKLYDGVIEMLNLLKDKGRKIYLLSNAQRVFTLYEMRILGIEKYFDDIFFSAEHKICKPDTTFFNLLLNKHNLEKDKTIMIGNDYICDILGATNAGLDSLYLHSNLSPEINGDLTSTYSLMDINLAEVSEILLK